MTSLSKEIRPRIYCDVSTSRTERGFSLERSRSIEDLANIGLTLESAVGLHFVFVDGNMKFNGVVVHDPELGFLATNQLPTEAESLKNKTLVNSGLSIVAALSLIASLLLALLFPVIFIIGTNGGGVDALMISSGIGLALAVLAIVIVLWRHDSGRWFAVAFAMVPIAIHLLILALGAFIYFNGGQPN